MNIVYLSPHFPPNYIHFAIQLRQYGAIVLGLADEPFDHLQPELKNALVEYYQAPNMNDYDQLVRALGYFTYKYGKIDRLDSLNEYWLETEARLRTDFNISGISLKQISFIKKKSEMKKRFQKAGIDVARGVIIKTESDVEKFIEQVGFPVVAKPDVGVGASKTYQISNYEDLAYFLSDRPNVDYFMEEYVEGVIQTFDGLTDRGGNVVFYTSHQYSQGIMETVNADDDIYYYSFRDIPRDLEKAGLATVKAFDVKERFFHFEYFRTPDQRIVGLEVNLRPPGGLTTDMFNYANDINIYQQWANIIVNNRFDAAYTRPYHCCYVGRKQNKKYLNNDEEIYRHYSAEIVAREDISGVFSAALGNTGYLVRSPKLAKVIEIAEFIQKKP